MSETPSTMIPLGSRAPHFVLTDTLTHEAVSLSDNPHAQATVIMFISNHCPYVKHIQSNLVKVANLYQAKGVRFIAICSNDITRYPEDGPDKMREVAAKWQYPFPYLFDETQAVAKAYRAACTPDFFVFDHDLKCVYRGCFDESTPGNNKPVTGDHLTRALDAILAGQAVDPQQRPSLGCNIKWKS